jgi:hypothetical protein
MDSPKNFIRKEEDFICEHCGKTVVGSGYTNHCPDCLWSKHVDNLPGDRANECQGLMEPIALELHGDKQQLLHRCQKCEIIKKNKVADNDNRDVLHKLPIQ